MANHGCLDVTLPEDLGANIFVRSTKEGIHAITNLKLVCKIFNRICDRDEVQRQLCLGNIPVYPASGTEESFHRFYGRLYAVGNTDAIFQTRLCHYFVDNLKEEGLLTLHQACLAGHDEGVLIYGVIMVYVGENTIQGYTILQRLFWETTLETWEFISALRENVLFGPPCLSYIAIADEELRVLMDKFDKGKCECDEDYMILAIERLLLLRGIIDQPIETLCEPYFWDYVFRFLP